MPSAAADAAPPGAAPDASRLSAPPVAPPAAALVERFRAALDALGQPDAAARIGVAVSGGADSTALLLLAHAALPGRVEAATVDHGLRPASIAEAAHVDAICAARGIPHRTLTGAWPDGLGEGLQAAARAFRYRLLAGWCAERRLATLVTGHHAEDQAETLLMRLARGSGVGGLGAIRPSRRLAADGWPILLVRPLLGFARAELGGIVAAAGIVPVDDPSNRDDRFDRTLARRLLATTGWLRAPRLAAAAGHLAEAEEALAWAAAQACAARVETAPDGTCTLDPAGLPAELLRRLVAHACAAIEHRQGPGTAPPPRPPAGPDLTRFVARLATGRSATLGRVLARPGAVWRFGPAPPRRG